MTKSYRRGTGFSLFRTLSGPALLALGFAGGAIFALVPAYYWYREQDLALRIAAGESAAPAQTPEGAKLAPAGEPPRRVASRLTYELSRPPASPAKTAAPASAPAKAASASASAPRARAQPAEDAPASKVANARPIFATPPDPRDTTREIEKETRRAYQKPVRQPAAAPAVPVQPRIIEGRDLVLPPKPQEKAPSDRSSVAAAGPAVSGASPISPPATESGRRNAGGSAKARSPAGGADNSRAAAADVKSRLAATRSWLGTAAPSTHTIQLMGVSNDEQLTTHLQTLSRVLEPSKIYVFRTVAQGKPSVTVIYGSYADRKAALEALHKLPPTVVANRPVLRTVKGIRAEMVQNRTDS